MTTYATEAQFIEAFGQQETIELTNLENPAANSVNSIVLVAALVYASGLIDSYLSGRYTLPLSTIPEVLIALCLDIARYRLGHNAQEEDVRKRYEDALKMLRDIANGILKLGLPTADEPVSSGSPDFVHPSRTFDSQTLRGF